MNTPNSLEWWLWVFSLAAAAVLLGRLYQTGLYRTYRFLFARLLIDLIRSLLLMQIPTNRSLYGWIFVVSEPILWALYVLNVLEITRLALREHHGITTLSKWFIAGSLAVAALISAAASPIDFTNPGEQFPTLLAFFAARRAVTFAMAVFLVLFTGFLAYFPVEMNRNTAFYAIGSAAYFLSDSFALLARTLQGHDVNRAMSTAMLAVSGLCLLVWIISLNRSGETRRVVIGRLWRPGETVRLLAQLEAMNSTLDRTGRSLR